jgi:hypothetical protein
MMMLMLMMGLFLDDGGFGASYEACFFIHVLKCDVFVYFLFYFVH